MSTDAKKAFDINIRRASYFLDIHQQTQTGAGAPTLARRELPRGAVVFAVGALDAYLSDVSADVVVTGLRSQPGRSDLRDVLRQVQKEVPTLSLEVALLPGETDRVRHIQNAVLDHFRTSVSGFGVSAVSAAVHRMGRTPSDFWSEIVNEYPDARAELDRWTEIRHQIVHSGMTPRVWRPHARKFIDLVRYIVAALDKYALAARKGLPR